MSIALSTSNFVRLNDDSGCRSRLLIRHRLWSSDFTDFALFPSVPVGQ